MHLGNVEAQLAVAQSRSQSQSDAAVGLAEFEELVVLTIMSLGNYTYGVPIREAMEKAGRKVNGGSLHVTLDRMIQKNYVEAVMSAPTPEQGGKSKRYYRVTGLGEAALRRTEQVRDNIRTNTNGLVGGTS